MSFNLKNGVLARLKKPLFEDSTPSAKKSRDYRDEISASSSKDRRIYRIGKDTLAKRQNLIFDQKTPHDHFFDNCIDRFLNQSYSTRVVGQAKNVRPNIDKMLNRSMNSHTYFSSDVQSTIIENSSSFLESDHGKYKQTQKPRFPKLKRKDIVVQSKEDQRGHPKLARLIYQNHPRSYMKDDQPFYSPYSFDKKEDFRDSFFLTYASVPDIDLSIDIYESDSEDVEKDPAPETKVRHQYQYPDHLKVTNQTYNDFFSTFRKGFKLRFDVKKLRQNFQTYIKMRDTLLGNKNSRRELEKRLKDSENWMKLAKIKALRKRLLEGATIRLALLTETAIKHVAGFELMRHLKDTMREEWEWYYLKIPHFEISECCYTPTTEDLIERKMLKVKKKPIFDLGGGDSEPILHAQDGLVRRRGFNATKNPKANPFGKRAWNPDTRRFTKVVDDTKLLGIKFGDPVSPVVSKWIKGKEYSSYWLECIDRCLGFDDWEDIDEAGYISTLRDKPLKYVEREMKVFEG